MAIKNAGWYVITIIPIILLSILLYLLLKKVNVTNFMWILFWIYIVWQSIGIINCFWKNLVYEE